MLARTEAMYLGQMMSNSNAGLEQQIRQFESAIREGKNYGQDTSALEKRKAEYEKILAGGGPQAVRAVNEFNNIAANPDANIDLLFSMVSQLPPDKQKSALEQIYKLRKDQLERAKKNKSNSDAAARAARKKRLEM